MSAATFLLVVAAIFVAVGWSLFRKWKSHRLGAKKERLETELRQLCAEISAFPSPLLTGEHIPQRFPSKQEAMAFGERWSRGGKEGFRAKATDASGCDEDHPNFDSATISGGILYTYPAIFFGMAEPYRDNQEWFIEFEEAKNKWLREYLAHLKAEAST